jgi:hypothetical protein
MRGLPRKSVLLAELDAMIARAEAACERLGLAASAADQHVRSRNNNRLRRQRMELVLAQLRRSRNSRL